MKNINKMQLNDLLLSFIEIWKYDKKLLFLLIADVVIDALLPFPGIILAGSIVDSIAAGNDFLMVIFYIALLFGSSFFLQQ